MRRESDDAAGCFAAVLFLMILILVKIGILAVAVGVVVTVLRVMGVL